jgi:hypothetical protein
MPAHGLRNLGSRPLNGDTGGRVDLKRRLRSGSPALTIWPSVKWMLSRYPLRDGCCECRLCARIIGANIAYAAVAKIEAREGSIGVRMTELMMPYNFTLAMPNLTKLTLPKKEDGVQPVCLDIAVSDQISTSIPISMTCVAGMLK